MERKRTVSYMQNYGMRDAVPMIRLTGKWLEQAGFAIGAEYTVSKAENGEIRLVKTEGGEEYGEGH